MRALLLLSLSLWVPARAFEPAASAALGQAEAVGSKGALAVYDNGSAKGGVSVPASAGESSGGCADETCGFRKGGPPPAALDREPKTPFTGDINPDGSNKKDSPDGFTWKTGLYMLLGAGAGAAAGFFIGGIVGAVIGGVLGGLLGLLLHKFS